MRVTLLRTTTIAAIAALSALAGSRAIAEGQQATPPSGTSMQASPPAKDDIPLKVDLVITRFEGEKKTSSLPFSLWVSTGNMTNVRMGSDVPIPTTTDGKAGVNYQRVGTQIDCRATSIPGGTFRLILTVQDSSVYGQEKTAQNASLGLVNGYPVIRSFSSQNSLVLRDGQSAEYVMATDKVTGEVLKVSVTLTVVK